MRKKGYGNKILALLIEECKKLDIKELQIGANEDNIASNKAIQNNSGTLFKHSNNKNFYKIKLQSYP